MTKKLAIAPVSLSFGLLSTTAASLVSPSVAAGYGLGWILQECTLLLPLLIVGAAAAAWLGRPLFDKVTALLGLGYGVRTGLLYAYFAHFLFRTARIRRRVHYLPGVPHSWIFGHLPAIIQEASQLPPNAHAFYMMKRLIEKYNLQGQGCLVLDTYPLTSYASLVIYGVNLSHQVTQSLRQFHKHQVLQELHRVIGKKGLVLLEGKEHKDIRTLFNHGLSQQKVMSMVDIIVSEVEVLAAKMAVASNADGGFVRSFHDHLMAATLDIIGRVVVGEQMHSQTQSHELSSTIKELEASLRSGLSNFSIEHLNIWRMFRMLRAERRARHYLSRLIRERWQQLISSGEIQKGSSLDMALWNYRVRLSPKEQISPLSNNFVNILSDNLKTFMHAGHDTTATAFAHVIIEMCNHPEILKEVRKEHDTVLGNDVSLASEIIRKEPNILLKLPLTLAVIQETLRVHSFVGTVRAGRSGEMLHADDSTLWDTEDFAIITLPLLLHRNTEFYPRPEEFIPHRWIPSSRPTGFPEIPANVFQPFEKGRRNCIGQNLAMLELRIIAVMLLRRFEFSLAYEELDRRLNRKPPQNSNLPRTYVVLIGAGVLCDGLPLFVQEKV